MNDHVDKDKEMDKDSIVQRGDACTADTERDYRNAY